MFDRTNLYRAGDSHTTNKYEMQPHDAADAARLYGEVKEKAVAAVEDVMIEKIDSIRAELIRFEKVRTAENFDTVFYIVYKINGKKFAHKVTKDEMQNQINGLAGTEAKFATYRKIAQDLAEEITLQILNQNMDAL